MKISDRIKSRGWTSAPLVIAVVACGSDQAREPEPYIPQPAPWSPTPPKKEAGREPEELPPRVPNPADGVCKRANVSSGVVDPDCVYLLGFTGAGYVGDEVLIDPFRPEDRAFGFGMPRRIIVNPADGEIWFLSRDSRTHLAMYVHEKNLPYYTGMLSKQRWIPSPSCPRFPEPWDFNLFADDGMPAYTCTTSETLVPWQSAPFGVIGYEFVALSHDRVGLAYDALEGYAVIEDGRIHPIAWTPHQRFQAARSRARGGFIAATLGGSFPNHLPLLWDVEVDGTIATRGSYDMGAGGAWNPAERGACKIDASGGVACTALGYTCALEVSGALLCVTEIAQEKNRNVEGVVRFTLSDPPQVVHDERTSDVKVSVLSKLVTGP